MVHWYYFQKRDTYYKTLIWPKSTVEMSQITKTKQKKSLKQPPCFWTHPASPLLCISYNNNKKKTRQQRQKCKYGDRNKCVCLVREINAHTIEFKKRWHIYCNINVIYIVFFCWKRQKILIFVAAVFWCASTIPFIWHKNKSFINQQRRLKSKTKVLGIWSSCETAWSPRLRATVQLCSWDAICNFFCNNGQVMVNNRTFYYLI